MAEHAEALKSRNLRSMRVPSRNEIAVRFRAAKRVRRDDWRPSSDIARALPAMLNRKRSLNQCENVLHFLEEVRAFRGLWLISIHD